MMSLIMATSTSIATGLVIIVIPASRVPDKSETGGQRSSEWPAVLGL
jgi:hypothetical protein